MVHIQTLSSIDPEDIYFILLLHSLLPPSVKTHNPNEDNKRRKIIKSTIKDSQNSFILLIDTVNNVDLKIDKLKSSVKEKGETLQPFIVYIKESNDYLVYFARRYI